eukprot:3788378-Amphidinium_carterae.1
MCKINLCIHHIGSHCVAKICAPAVLAALRGCGLSTMMATRENDAMATYFQQGLAETKLRPMRRPCNS